MVLKINVLLSIFVFAILLLSGCTTTGSAGAETSSNNRLPNAPSPVVPEGFTPYSSQQHGFSMAYPNGWEMQEEFMGSAVFFASPRENSGDAFSENVNVVVEDLKGRQLSPRQYFEISSAQLENLITDYNPVEEGAATIGVNDAYRTAFTSKQGKFSLKQLQIVTIKNGRAYVFSYSAEQSSYDKYLPLAEKTIESARIG